MIFSVLIGIIYVDIFSLNTYMLKLEPIHVLHVYIIESEKWSCA